MFTDTVNSTVLLFSEELVYMEKVSENLFNTGHELVVFTRNDKNIFKGIGTKNSEHFSTEKHPFLKPVFFH